MPHVVLEGDWSIQQYWEQFRPFERQGDPVVKVASCYLNWDRREALLDALAVDRGRPQRFFLALQAKPEGLVVKLSPASAPERTLGVKRAVAMLAESVQQMFGGLHVTHTNLEQFLET